ncbi:MAG: ACP S-malonyltransferase [Deltaproteobacteria bacterium]|jgi:[acyl-carrier-protein] S-malonyltransferase|nr:ACP S-malonyltransferase [Deltaproteobacteria bacterium]MBW2477171.1 ACP S-malonyltransferase [Deltaproteobacteria bacterium]MBW2520736.1 ACP S-malonyltransferase [Deltaproteobacteria bacterium]
MIAFLFPGQGSQHAGMGKNLADNFPLARHVFEEANDTLNFNLSSLCFDGPDEKLKLTEITQPAILTVSVAALRILQQETGLKPDFAAGHSLGEYSALVCSGALDFPDAVKIVHQRGTFMQEAVPVGVGSMAAIIGLTSDELLDVCKNAAQDQIVSPANYNSDTQVVIAGHAEAVERAIGLAKEKGAKRAMPLPVSAPFHCALMQPAGERLAKVLDAIDVKPMQCPVISNVEAVPNQSSDRVVELLVNQVSAPVRWAESMQAMLDLGVERFVEIGPGKVLSGLLKRIAKQAKIENVQDAENVRAISV